MKDIYCVIMAGGIGSRFWPMSRTSFPKQFHDVLGTGSTLLQQTFERFTQICPAENIFVVTSDIYKSLVVDQLDNIKEENILLEPSRRNTAPCIAYANHRIAQENPNAVVIVAPSDHMVLKETAFNKTMACAVDQAKTSGNLVTLGIKPSRPDTGYGYIQFKDDSSSNYAEVKKVKTFTEKPDIELAREFIKSGDFYWNSGIFIWSIEAIMNAFQSYLPEIDDLFKEVAHTFKTPEESESIAKVYAVCESISIDYGVLEKAKNVNVVLSDFGWSDLGTWGSLYAQLQKDSDNNAIVGKKVVLHKSTGNMISVPDDKLVVLQGLEDFILIDTEDVLLICPKTDEQKIKQIVNDLKISKKEKYV